MKLLDKLSKQVIDGEIKSGDTMQDWLDTLEVEEFEELERLVALLEEEPEDEETVELGQLVTALYAVEKKEIEHDGSTLVVPELEEDEFFKLLNSFLFMLPFYYWADQDLMKITPCLSLVVNQKNGITIKLTEYGKGDSEE